MKKLSKILLLLGSVFLLTLFASCSNNSSSSEDDDKPDTVLADRIYLIGTVQKGIWFIFLEDGKTLKVDDEEADNPYNIDCEYKVISDNEGKFEFEGTWRSFTTEDGWENIFFESFGDAERKN